MEHLQCWTASSSFPALQSESSHPGNCQSPVSSPSTPWQPPSFILFLWIHLFWILPVNGVIRCALFWIWRLSLAQVFELTMCWCVATLPSSRLSNIPLRAGVSHNLSPSHLLMDVWVTSSFGLLCSSLHKSYPPLSTRFLTYPELSLCFTVYLPEDTREASLIPDSERSPGGGNGNPLQNSCLENFMDRGVWRAVVYGVARVRHGCAHRHTLLWEDTL